MRSSGVNGQVGVLTQVHPLAPRGCVLPTAQGTGSWGRGQRLYMPEGHSCAALKPGRPTSRLTLSKQLLGTQWPLC